MRRAFTLVELLVVVIIAAILIAVTLPTIKYSLDQGKLREGARQANAFFASAQARAMATGRPVGVWLELEKVGDPAAAPGMYQCSQLYLAETPQPFTGDVSNAVCAVEVANPPYGVSFLSAGPHLETLVEVGEEFSMRLDFKGHIYSARRTAAGFEIVSPPPPTNPVWLGVDGLPGIALVDDDGNGIVDDAPEVRYPGSDDLPASSYAKYEVVRQPKRAGQPLELPRGVVLDMSYCGLGASGMELSGAASHVLVMFSPTGGIGEVSWISNSTGTRLRDHTMTALHLLVGRTQKVEPAWQNVPASNIADGSALWLAVSRRNGSVATVENAPNITLPISTLQERQAFISTAREFASTGEVIGGQ